MANTSALTVLTPQFACICAAYVSMLSSAKTFSKTFATARWHNVYEETPPSHPQPEPPAQPAPAPPAVPAPVPQVNGKVRKLRCWRSDNWDPAIVHAAYKKRFPHRQMTMADLPAPQSPEDDPCKCPFCPLSFPSPGKCGHYSRTCSSIPYPEWLRRVRVCQLD